MTTRIATLTREALEDAAEQAGVYEYEIRGDYSGRAMYGDNCLGITAPDAKDVYAILCALAVEEAQYVALAIPEDRPRPFDAEDIIELIRASRQDSMGCDVIVYWPGVELVED